MKAAGLKALVAVAALAPALAGCVIYDSTSGEDVSVRIGEHGATAASAPLEALKGVRFEPGAVVVTADSNGCTAVSDFAVEVAEGDVIDLTFTREKPDMCRALVPNGVELRWSYADLGLEAGKSVAVRNPVKLP